MKLTILPVPVRPACRNRRRFRADGVVRAGLACLAGLAAMKRRK
ncbi:MAG: hypothetical protein ACLUI3_10465 [Christensenellales bacterium]